MPLPAASVTPYMQHAALPTLPNGSRHAGELTLAFRIRRRSDGLVLRHHRLILMPQRFTQTTEARTALYYTQGGPVADTLRDGGVGITYFQIQGHTGYWGVLAPNAGPLGNRLDTVATLEGFTQLVEQVFTGLTTGQPLQTRQSFVDGAAAIKGLQDDILAYFAPQQQGGPLPLEEVTQTQDLQLEFFNYTAPVSAEDQTGRVGWIIHPHRGLVDIQQDANKPFLYQYSFQFAALGPVDVPLEDPFVQQMSAPESGLRTTLRQITATTQAVTNGVNTISDAFNELVIQQVTGPIGTFLTACDSLGTALEDFATGVQEKVRFPLYAQRTLEDALAAPSHSVTTLGQAAVELGHILADAMDPRSISRLFAATSLIGSTNDVLTLSLNQEPPVAFPLGTQTSGTAIATALQAQVRAQPPAQAANAAAYRDFTATYDGSQYILSSGTKGSDAASVRVIVSSDPLLTPTDASVVLGLGVANGGQEHQGSAYGLPALALLRGVEEACTHLQAFPDYFATQLATQDAALAALLPPGVTRPQLRGDQRMLQTRITPGDTLQGIANRVRVDWQTLAVVNRLTYPFILDEPTTLGTGRVSRADLWQLTDVAQAWTPSAYQGQRVDIVSGPGAGQSRRIVRNTATQLVLETAWSLVPTDTSTYAIRSATNPIQQTGTVTSATPRTVTDGSLALVPESQRGLILLLTSGPAAGARRQIVDNDATTYRLDREWDVVPVAGSLYALLGPQQATFRQKIVGDLLAVPHPSSTALPPVRSRLQDVSAITGQHVTTEEQLFGRDLVLLDGSLLYDPTLGDAGTIAGLVNLRQALLHYINLPLAELEYAPYLGSYLREELGLSATLPLQIQLLSSLERTIKQDARIQRLNGAHLVTQGGLSMITFGVTAINGASVNRITVR